MTKEIADQIRELELEKTELMNQQKALRKKQKKADGVMRFMSGILKGDIKGFDPTIIFGTSKL